MRLKFPLLVATGIAAALLLAPSAPWSTTAGRPSLITQLVPTLEARQEATDPADLRVDRVRLEAMADAARRGLNWIPGELLVKFKPGIEPVEAARALAALREPERVSATRWVGDALLIQTPGEDNAEQAAERLAREPEILWAQPNFIRHTQSTPNDTDYSRQWHFPLINIPAAWDINAGANSSVTVAVVDSGVTETTRTYNWWLWTGYRREVVTVPYATNPDIEASRFVTGRDFVFWSAGTPVLDTDGHGTHVAGTILQTTGNSLGTAGIAYKARLLPVKVCLSEWDWQIIWSSLGYPGYSSAGAGCTTDSVVQGIRYAADQGANVINLSLGGEGTSPAELEAIRYAVSKGAFVSLSAGNNYEQGNRVRSPAMYGQQIDGAMTVGAVGRSKRRAYYSNTSSGTEIAAPGGDFRDGSDAGAIQQVTLYAPDSDWDTVIRPRFDRYATRAMQGTSMAAPHIAGVAALLHSQGIRNPAAIEAAIKKFANDLGPTGRDDEYGYGLVDARATLRGMGVAR